MTNLPTISIVIPTLNEQHHIDTCLASIFNQDYPAKLLEVIVVDDDSTDATVKIARKYPVKILHNGQHHGEIGKMIGFRSATGDLFMYLDADIELISPNWLRLMVKPLMDDPLVVGSFTREGAGPASSPIERYLSFDALQRDGLYQWLTPSVESTITTHTPDYSVCTYTSDRIPPAGRCVYRRSQLAKFIYDFDMFLELDFLVLLVRAGLTHFAYVPQAVMHHHHVSSLSQLLTKRTYNLTKVYLRHVSNNLYTWITWTNPLHLIKLGLWVIYANLFIPSLIVGVYKSLKYRDLAGLYEPVVNIAVTDTLLFTMLKTYVSKS